MIRNLAIAVIAIAVCALGVLFLLGRSYQAAAITGFVYSPDGTTALSTGSDGTVELLDAETGKELKHFTGFGSPTIQAAYSKTGSQAIVGASDGSIVTIDIASGKESSRLQTPAGLDKMALAPDDRSVAALDTHNKVRIYRDDGALLSEFSGSGIVSGITWCPGSDCILLWGKDGLLEVWNPFVPAFLANLRGHRRDIRAAVFSRDGERLCTTDVERSVLVWNSSTGNRMFTLPSLTEDPLALAWSRDRRRIAVETISGKAYVWDVDGGQPVIIGPEHGTGQGWITFTPGGQRIMLGGWSKGPTATEIPEE